MSAQPVFASGQLWLFGARTVVELGILVLAVRYAPRAGKRPVLTGAAAAVAITLATTTAALPLRAAARQRAKDVGLITQGWGGWAVDVAKSTAIGGVFAAGGGALLVLGIRRFGRDWWAPGAAAVAGFAVVFSYLGPVVLDPMFNQFKALPAGETRDDVLELARRAGVEVGEVYEVDASRRTTAANAYVTGLGHTKRVVLYDTLLKEFTPAETRLVVAHELGHVRHKDVPGGLLWVALVAPFGTLVVARATEKLTRDGRSPVPAAVLSLALVAPALTMISNQLSRAVERRADAFALELTGRARGDDRLRAQDHAPERRRPRPAALAAALHGHAPDDDGADRRGAGGYSPFRKSGRVSGRRLMPSRVDHLDQLSSMASISSRIAR